MIDEASDAMLDDELNALLERPFTELSVDELMAMKTAYAAHGVRVVNGVPWEVVAPMLAGAAIYSKTFLETLAKHNAEALMNALRTRKDSRTKDSRTIAFLVALDSDEIVKFEVIGDLPDQARRALSEPSVIADALRHVVLRWDEKAVAWRPYRRAS